MSNTGMIAHVQQIDDYTCGQAALAMVAEITIEEAADVIRRVAKNPTAKGLYSRDMERALIMLDIEFEALRFPEIRMQVPHIVTVPSLLTPGGMHYAVIAFDEGKFTVLDPQWHREHRLYYSRTFDDVDGTPLTGYAEVIRILANGKRAFY